MVDVELRVLRYDFGPGVSPDVKLILARPFSLLVPNSRLTSIVPKAVIQQPFTTPYDD